MEVPVPLLRLPDGRDLEYDLQGPSTGPVVLFHHGMPGSAVPMGTVLGSMTDRGFRVVTYSRAGYGASSPATGRTVLDTAADCAFLLTHLGITHYLVAGWSAGGPHALASAAVAPDRVEGVLLVASFAPFDADGLDYVDGMGAQNVAQFGTVGHGDAAMRELVGQMAAAVRGHASADVATEMASLLPPADLAVLTGEYGADNAANMDHGLSRGDEGWVADLAALTGPWGFDLAAVTAPVELWHGAVDRMVPITHGRWLAEHLPTAKAHLEPEQGHLSLVIGSLGEKLAILSERAQAPESRPFT
jgi:pimeloyl-ACP methyl ester carboxylesterase